MLASKLIAEWTIGQATHDINQEKINEYVIGLNILVYLGNCYYHWHHFQLSKLSVKLNLLVIRLHSNSYGGYVVDLTKAR